MKKHRAETRCFFVFGMMGLLAIVFAWRTYLFAYFYLSSLLFLLDIAFDTHAIQEVYCQHKKRQSQKTLSLAMPQLVGVPGFEGRSPREDTAEKINIFYPRNRINRESHAVRHCNTSRRLVFGVAERRVGTCSHLFVALTAQKKRQSKNSVVSNAPTCRGTRIRTWDPLLPKQMR